MDFKNISIMNFENAIHGMRNPMNSWKHSDSIFDITDMPDEVIEKAISSWGIDSSTDQTKEWLYDNGIINYSKTNKDLIELALIGPKDMKLAQSLIKAGPEHRKFLRQIFVSVDISAPLYWWKEFDTYKVGTVANSTSTMHKIASKPITMEMFECGDENDSYEENYFFIKDNFIPFLESLRTTYLETKDKKCWKDLIRWLPESWIQTRTVTMNYENLLGMCSCGQRRFHKLSEWSKDFIYFARSLPYSQEFIFFDENKNKEI